MRLNNLYAVLGVPPRATSSDLTAHHRELVHRHHPDVGGRHDQMAAINTAWRILGDPARRSTYDALRSARDVTTAQAVIDGLAVNGPNPSATRRVAWDILAELVDDPLIRLQAAQQRDALRANEAAPRCAALNSDQGESAPLAGATGRLIVPGFDVLVAYDCLGPFMAAAGPGVLLISQSTLSAMASLVRCDESLLAKRAMQVLERLAAIHTSDGRIGPLEVVCEVPADAANPEPPWETLIRWADRGTRDIAVLVCDDWLREGLQRGARRWPGISWWDPAAWAGNAGIRLPVAFAPGFAHVAPARPTTRLWRFVVSAGRHLVFLAAAYSAIMTWGISLAGRSPLWLLLPMFLVYWLIGQRLCVLIGQTSGNLLRRGPFIERHRLRDLGAASLSILFVLCGTGLVIAHYVFSL